jgi:transcriptional regulator with XRE-family HTH domain
MSDRSATGPPGSGGSSPRAGADQRPRPLLRTTLGDVLRRIRLEQRRTLADVARAAKVSMPYLSEVERGRKEASSEVLGAICDALRIELSDLLALAGRELVDRSAPVVRQNVVRLDLVRLEAIRGRRGPSQPSGSGDARCLLAA